MQHTIKLLHNFVRSRIFRVGVIGVIGVIIQTIIFELLGIWLKLVPASTAAIIGGETAILVNFALNQRFSFNDRVHGGLLLRLARFHLVVAGSLFFQWLFIFMTEQVTSNVFWIHAAYLCGIGLGFLTNYLGYYFFVWRSHHEKPRTEQSM